jgi:uncharacterized lipoprotein YmbA
MNEHRPRAVVPGPGTASVTRATSTVRPAAPVGRDAPLPTSGAVARAAAAVLAGLTLAGAVGCSLLEPVPDRTQWYTLPAPAREPAARPASPSPAAPTPSASPGTLGLGPVTLPPYLDRPEVVTRAAPERIAVSSRDRWAAPLPLLFRRALAEELRARFPAWQLVEWPWTRTPPPDLAVAVDILRFEADASGGAVLEARWTVRIGAGAPVPGETRVAESAPAGDVAASVAALGRAVGTLANDLAAAARRSAAR